MISFRLIGERQYIDLAISNKDG